jgi:hypothetical protein
MLDGLDEEEVARTMRWWATLSEDARLEFVQMWDARTDDTALCGTSDNGSITWHEVPIELRGALIDEENDREHKQAKSQLLEYISNHEDIQFFLLEKRFHICRAHTAARDVIRGGMLRADFECPVDEASCPMRAILNACPGRSIALRPSLRTLRP